MSPCKCPNKVQHRLGVVTDALAPAKVSETLFQKQAGCVVHTCSPSHLGGRGRRIASPRAAEQNCETLSEKQAKAKKDWGMAHGWRACLQVQGPEFKPRSTIKKRAEHRH
jgi:hypothetical protein